MIKIEVEKNKNIIDKIVVSGHSGYAEEGFDIVCASVSSICTTTVNAIIKINNTIEYETRDGFLSIKILKHDSITDKLIENMLDLLKELEEQYKNYIKIK